MAESVLKQFKQKVESLTLVPSGGGKFEVSADGELIFSKKAEGRFPEVEELVETLGARVG